jgi:hypothetical protein
MVQAFSYYSFCSISKAIPVRLENPYNPQGTCCLTGTAPEENTSLFNHINTKIAGKKLINIKTSDNEVCRAYETSRYTPQV